MQPILWAPVRHHTPEPEPEPTTWWDYFDAHRALPMAAQVYEWTCSICAATWVLQATGVSPHQAREQTAGEIGYPDCVNPSVGLADTTCLVHTFEDHGFVAHQEWLDFDRAYQLASETTGVLNSTRWYHFVGVRGVSGNNIWVANSAPGYQGIWDLISRQTYEAWAGSWQMVWLEP